MPPTLEEPKVFLSVTCPEPYKVEIISCSMLTLRCHFSSGSTFLVGRVGADRFVVIYCIDPLIFLPSADKTKSARTIAVDCLRYFHSMTWNFGRMRRGQNRMLFCPMARMSPDTRLGRVHITRERRSTPRRRRAASHVMRHCAFVLGSASDRLAAATMNSWRVPTNRAANRVWS